MRFTHVPFGNRCSPLLLNATIRLYLSYFPTSQSVKELHENFHVDDLLSGADSDEQASNMLQEAVSIMQKAGMTLTKQESNSGVVLDKLYKEQEGKHLDLDMVKVLSLKWLVKQNCFAFEGIVLPCGMCVTK